MLNREYNQREPLSGSRVIRSVTTLLALGYLASSCALGTLNPLKWQENIKRQESESVIAHENYQRIFGSYGLADTNKDGEVDDLEKARVYDKMGVKYVLNFIGDQPSRQDLTKFLADNSTPTKTPTKTLEGTH